MSKKVVVMEDFTVRGTDTMHKYDVLAEKYGADVKYIHVQKYIHTGDEFAEMFLNMEKNGPDVIREEEELLLKGFLHKSVTQPVTKTYIRQGVK